MTTRIAEVGDGIHQVSTYLPDIDFALNQYLITGDEPMLFHTGMRWMFPSVAEAIATVVPVASIRWIGFGHVEADECGSMNDWLAASAATVVQGSVGCTVSIGDLADRAPRALGPGERLDLGGHVVEWIDTPHVPHAWEAGVLVDHSTRTLFCGDLFGRMGDFPPTTADDVVGPAIEAEDDFPSMSLHPATGSVIRGLADLDVGTLALMHGPTFTGDCRAALHDLADDAERRIARV